MISRILIPAATDFPDCLTAHVCLGQARERNLILAPVLAALAPEVEQCDLWEGWLFQQALIHSLVHLFIEVCPLFLAKLPDPRHCAMLMEQDRNSVNGVLTLLDPNCYTWCTFSSLYIYICMKRERERERKRERYIYSCVDIHVCS